MKKPVSINECIQKLVGVKLPHGEKAQLIGLVRDYGFLGALEYLKPHPMKGLGNRDQKMADNHRAILLASFPI